MARQAVAFETPLEKIKPESPPSFHSGVAAITFPLRSKAKAGGGGEIRTHEAFRPSGFQDRRDQPLCHPSGELVISDRGASIAGTQRFARQRNMFM